jgi:multiple sugar transport system permease protein
MTAQSSAYRSPLRLNTLLGVLLRYAILLLFVIVMAFPFYYMTAVSFATDQQIHWLPIPVVPRQISFINYVRIWDVAPFGRFFLNSLLVSGSITMLHLVFDPLAGYVFAKFRFKGRHTLFLMILGTLMIPFFLRMIPLYWLIVKLHWVNSYVGLIVPFASSAYGIFMMRQFVLPFPSELLDAARVDGASELRIFTLVVLPNLGPALAANALFTFVYQWNNFLWPLIITSSTSMRTLTLGLTFFYQEGYTRWNLMAAASMLLFLPILTLFLVTQRFFVRGTVTTGFK